MSRGIQLAHGIVGSFDRVRHEIPPGTERNLDKTELPLSMDDDFPGRTAGIMHKRQRINAGIAIHRCECDKKCVASSRRDDVACR